MKIAHFTSGFPVLSETFVRDEIQAFSDAGVENVVVSLRPRKNVEKNEIEFLDPNSCRYPVIHPEVSIKSAIGWNHGLPPWNPASTLSRERIRNLYLKSILPSAIEALKKGGVNHCHAHFAHYPATLAWMCARSLKVGFTFNAHSYDLYNYHSFLREKILDADRVFPISNRNGEFMKAAAGLDSVGLEKIETFRCGIDLSRYPLHDHDPNRNRAPLIVAVGRLVDTKGFATLVEAIPIVLEPFPETRVEIVGEGPERARLLRLMDRLGLGDRVLLRGALDRESTRQLQSNATVIVQPCCEGKDGLDGIPVVLMEAMALGIPVVSTDFAAIPELIEDGVSGLLVPPRDPRSLAEAILSILHQRIDLTKLVRVARRRIEESYDGPKNYREKARRILDACGSAPPPG